MTDGSPPRAPGAAPAGSVPVDLHAAIADHRFVRGLAPAHVDLLAGLAVERQFAPGAWILRLGDEARELHLIIAGRVAVEIADPAREPLVVTTLHDGDIAGWSWHVPPHRVQFDVVALGPVTTIAIDAAALRAVCEADHELGYQMAQRLARVLSARLAATRLQLMDVYGHAR